MLPDFLYIGPDKSGSTWLYEVLRTHPDCFVPPIKDIYFFDRYYDYGLGWYEQFFRDAPAGSLAVGELSHDYLFSPEAARRIARDLPGVRLLTFLRDPADRSFSQYLYMIRSGMTRGTFEEACRSFPEIIDNSRYFLHLESYLERFARSRIRILLFDDLVFDARSFAVQVLEFLGLQPRSDIDYVRRVLPASRPRSFLAARLAKAGANVARHLGAPGLVGVVKGSRLAGLIYAPYGVRERPSLDREDRRRLIEIFRPDVERLEELLGRDLDHWLSDGPAGPHARVREVGRTERPETKVESGQGPLTGEGA
jgi:hypothetical protein